MTGPLPNQRESGVLMHISSLPGRGGVGDLGDGTRRLLDWLAAAGQRWWQVLPLGPTGYGESPYQALSMFAGNPMLVDLDAVGAGTPVFAGADDHVDFAWQRQHRLARLADAARSFAVHATDHERQRLDAFVAASPWLSDFSLFCALKQHFEERPWHLWPAPFATRDPAALEAFRREHASALQRYAVEQFWFHEQWQAVRQYARAAGVSIIGDIPIYVAHDSADVWCAPHLFDLDSNGNLNTVAGVPPDYFSATGQRWGNPLYRWDVHRADDFAWWRSRLAHSVTQFDLVRIDHFRAFDSYWEIQADCPTAVDGSWREGPGIDFFDRVQHHLGALPLIAEDLGMLTEGVHQLRDRLGLPGMRVLQFGFDGQGDNPHAPGNIGENVVCYTGTHDNDTSVGWYEQADAATRMRVDTTYDALATGCAPADPAQRLISLAMASPAKLAMLPMQDVLGLGGEARMNTPGVVGGNWTWRASSGALNANKAATLAQLTRYFER
ncbi:MAG: 4-alpha-glucanotransferase [Pseudomonadales bacterium]|nr:4-alpha-glucanotransferase [Pseudomonadales bacterium]